MAESTLLTVATSDEPGFTSPGRYGCIDNICVSEHLRGQGLGWLLVQASCDALVAQAGPLDGFLLWYNLANTQATHFWSRMEFTPLWTTYQKRDTA